VVPRASAPHRPHRVARRLIGRIDVARRLIGRIDVARRPSSLLRHRQAHLVLGRNPALRYRHRSDGYRAGDPALRCLRFLTHFGPFQVGRPMNLDREVQGKLPLCAWRHASSRLPRCNANVAPAGGATTTSPAGTLTVFVGLDRCVARIARDPPRTPRSPGTWRRSPPRA
jgi:hypothetical protein